MTTANASTSKTLAENIRGRLLQTRNEISFRHKKIMFTLLSIAGKIKYNFVSEVVGVSWSINKVQINQSEI